MQPRILNPRAAADPIGYMDEVRQTEFGRRYKREALRLLELAPGQSVLDVGCGPGAEVLEFARAVGPAGRALGIDSHDMMIVEARRRAARTGSRAEFAIAEVADLGFPDASFDRCHADRTLQLLGERRRDALAEIVRVLKPAGYFVACAPDAGSFLIDIGEREVTAKILGFVADRGWPGRALPNLLKDCGLIDLELLACSGWGTDFRAIDASTPLETLAQWAEEAGAITGPELELWLCRLEEAVARDRFAFCSTMLIARGTKPG